MKRFRVEWTEKHASIVYAKNEEEAVGKALEESSYETCKSQSIDRVDTDGLEEPSFEPKESEVNP